jgi:hypothetical protein
MVKIVIQAGQTCTLNKLLYCPKNGKYITSWSGRGGWPPYAYVLRGLAEDFCPILNKEWVDTGAFTE